MVVSGKASVGAKEQKREGVRLTSKLDDKAGDDCQQRRLRSACGEEGQDAKKADNKGQ